MDGVAFWISLFFMFRTTLSQAVDKPPHIIFIVADDLGWNDVGWHNPNMYTPNLDRMALNGVRLNSSYVLPTCTPSRNCFMTGYYPYHTGFQINHRDRPNVLPTSFTTLPQELKALGYTAHIVGKWHLGFCNWKYTPTYRGFDSFMGFYTGAVDYYTRIRGKGYDFRWNTSVYHAADGEYSTNVIARHAVDVINRVDPGTQPLYLYLPFQAVHGPLQVPQKYMDLPAYQNIQNIRRRTYCGMVSALDEAVGNITTALKERGFLDNAILVFTTDNGGKPFTGGNNLPLRGAKTTLWEGGTKGVAFVYSETLLNKTNYLNTEMIHAVDWFPTLLTLAGGTPDTAMDGKNQWLTISEGLSSARTEFVYDINDLLNRSAIRMGKYKMIKGYPGDFSDWYPVLNLAEDDSTINKSKPKDFPPYQLFDIEADPTEHFNIADQHPDILATMKSRLSQDMESLVPAQYPDKDPRSDPENFGGVWSPGWC